MAAETFALYTLHYTTNNFHTPKLKWSLVSVRGDECFFLTMEVAYCPTQQVLVAFCTEQIDCSSYPNLLLWLRIC